MPYVDSRQCYLIDDGERHWYVAGSPKSAMDLHMRLMAVDDISEVVISDVSPSTVITVGWDSLREALRHGMKLDLNVPDLGPIKIGLPAHIWARLSDSPSQLCSSVS